MKSKTDSRRRNSSQAEAGRCERERMSRHSSNVDQQTDVSTGKGWPVVEMLRRNLKVLGEPFPDSVTQLLGMESRFSELDALPKAITAQGLDQSDTLRQSVPVFPFTEEELLGEVASCAHRQGAVPENPSRGGVGGRAGLDASYPAATTGKANDPESVPAPSPLTAQDSVLESRAHNLAGAYKEPVNKTMTERLGEDVLTPDFMQLWIDEILSTDLQDTSMSGQHAPGMDKRCHPPGSDDASIKSRSARPRVFSEPKNVSGKLTKTTSAVVSHPAPKESGDRFAGATRSSSHRFRPGSEMVAAGRSGSARKHESPNVYPEALVQMPESALPGVVLLRQLVQQEYSAAPSGPVRLDTPRINAAQKPAAADQHASANITAWREPEKSLRATSHSRHSNTENTVGSGSDSTSTDSHGFVYQDESERIATLVNDALVEQAIRHGVDLS